jgi:NAD(P)-dependent dehydrogenase (short-subunit alcohol dehydrogenase family)
MDLLDPASVDTFASRFLATGRPLDILVNRAHLRGVMPYAVDPRSAEQLWTLSERLLDLRFL